MQDCRRVKVSGAPGFRDFEGEITFEATRPDGVTMCLIWTEWEGEEVFEIVESKYVTNIEEV